MLIPRRGPTCAYCGAPKDDMEHVVPKAMLVDPAHPLVAPACKACNDEKSLDDEYLNHVFAIRIETANNPDMALIREKMERAALNPEFGSPARTILSTFRRFPVVTPAGDFLGYSAEATADAARIHRGLRWIIRGLHHWQTGEVLPDDPERIEIWGWTGGPENKTAFDKHWPTFGDRPVHMIGGTTLEFRCISYPDVPGYSRWLLNFFQRVFHVATVNREALSSRAKELSIDFNPK